MKKMNLKYIVVKSTVFLAALTLGMTTFNYADGASWGRDDHDKYEDLVDDLGINDEQEDKLEEIFKNFRKNKENKRAWRNLAKVNLQKMLASEAKSFEDIDKILANTYQESVAQMPTLLESMEKAHQILTKEQRQKLALGLIEILNEEADEDDDNKRYEKKLNRFNKKIAKRFDLDDNQKNLLANVIESFEKMQTYEIFKQALVDSADEIVKDTIDKESILQRWQEVATNLATADNNLALALADFKATLSEEQTAKMNKKLDRYDKKRRWFR